MRVISDNSLAAVTIWQEARGESYEGKLAVAEVIRNRMNKKYTSDGTVPGTVLRPFQFSGWNTGDPNRIPSMRIREEDFTVKDCMRAWEAATFDKTQTVNGAVLYYAPKVVSEPSWAKNCIKVAEVGNHLFFVPKPGF